MKIDDLTKKITQDLAVELADEFDRNFERKAFFTDKWPTTKNANTRGTLMMRSGNLRRSIRYSVRDDMILWSSSLPYASVHNEGGEIEVTAKMKKFFWAMYYKAAGAITQKKGGEDSKSKRNQKLTAEASKWKALALLKVGHKMKVEKRQMVGDHAEVAKIVKTVFDENIELLNQDLIKSFKK
jgi:phage gpG-like protein